MKYENPYLVPDLKEKEFSCFLWRGKRRDTGV
jgi:hypothetical protein